MYSTRISRTLYSIEPEDCHGFFIEHYRCDKPNCNRCRFNVSLINKLKIPLANVDDMLNSAQHDPNLIFYHKNVNNIMSLIKVKPEDHKNVNNIMLNNAQHDPNVIFYHKNVNNIMSWIKVKPEDHRYNVVNSCNGLLCLVKQASDPSWFNPVAVVCNPVTGEFLCCEGIRRKNNYDYRHSVTCGLGFDTKNSLYKIVQICIQWTQNPAWGSAVCAQIRSAYAYIMGVSYWRNLKTKINYLISEWKNVAPPATITPLKPHSPTYFCGALHWVFADKSNDSNCKILSFDLDEEQFHFHGIRISLPSEIGKGHNLAMGVLRDCLSPCDNFGQGRIDIWMMKEYGVWESWTKFFSNDIGSARVCCNGFYEPVFYLDNGALVMFNSPCNELVYYDESRGLRFKYFRPGCRQPDVEIIVHAPNSFILLKDILKDSPVRVWEVKTPRRYQCALAGRAKKLIFRFYVKP